jgi:uncharacterized protein YegJ (DUF2314 family)
MGILTNLNQGKKIRFELEDLDVWGYSEGSLQQYVNGSLTGNVLTVSSVNEETIIIDWGGVTSSLDENKFSWED